PDGTVGVSPCPGDCGRRLRAASEKRGAPIANFKLFSLFISITYRSENRNSSRRDANLESEICISTPIPHRPNAVSPLRPPNPSAVPPLETSGRSAGLRHKTSRHPRNPKRQRDLSPHGKSPSLLS